MAEEEILEPRLWPDELRKIFRAIIFDWDVLEKHERENPAEPRMIHHLETILSDGIVCALVTQRSFESIESTVLDWIAPHLRHHLWISCHSGAEVFSFKEDGQKFRYSKGPFMFSKNQINQWIEENILNRNQISPKDSIWVGAGALSRTDGSPHLIAAAEEFTQFLIFQHELHLKARTVDEATWLLEQEGFDPSQERAMESIFCIGNGFLGIRGSMDIPLPSSQADLFIAGVYDAKIAGLPYSEIEFIPKRGEDDFSSEMVPFPFPFRLAIKVDGTVLKPSLESLLDQARTLDMRKGRLSQTYIFKTKNGTLLVETTKRAALHDPHLLLQEIRLTSRGSDCSIEANTSLEFPEMSVNHPHLTIIPQPTETRLAELACFETQKSKVKICVAQRLWIEDREKFIPKNEFLLKQGEPIVLRQLMRVHTSRDTHDPAERSARELLEYNLGSFPQLIRSHEAEWTDYWDHADIVVTNDGPVTQALRFNLYQLRIAASPDPTVSVPARSLSGRAYQGHVFWDSEIFVLPFYLHTTPELARGMLDYRYHTLEGARSRAKKLGFHGACYAWESTVTGEDVTPEAITIKSANKEVPIFTGNQQIHISADIPYAICRYWTATEDNQFMLSRGLEILCETARFWASRVTPRAGQYHLLHVIGPDEYHHDVDNNAFTNWMVRAGLAFTVSRVKWAKHKAMNEWATLKEKLNFKEEELRLWSDIGQRLFIPPPDKNGVIEQFEGFFDLKESQLKKEEVHRAPIHRLINWSAVNQYKIIKQADVLMIPFLFPTAWPQDQVRANFEYYEPLTDHASSLSPSVHAAVAALAGSPQKAREYWEKALFLDLQNLMRNTGLGIHIANIGGTWQALVFHILGITFESNGTVEPTVNGDVGVFPSWEEIRLRLLQKGRDFSIQIKQQQKGERGVA